MIIPYEICQYDLASHGRQNTGKATTTQVSQFLFSREELRQISRWFLLARFLFRGVVLYGEEVERELLGKTNKRNKGTHVL